MSEVSVSTVRAAGFHLEVRHVFVALLRAGVVGQLDVPEARQLVNQERVLFDHRVEDVLQTHTCTHTD